MNAGWVQGNYDKDALLVNTHVQKSTASDPASKGTVEKTHSQSGKISFSTNSRKSFTVKLNLKEQKIQEISKRHKLSETFIKNEISKLGLNENEQLAKLISLDKTLNQYKSPFKAYSSKNLNPFTNITLKQLNKVAASAFFTLKNQSMTVHKQGRFIARLMVVKDEEGNIHISKEKKILGEGTFGIATLFHSVTKNLKVVIKTAKNDEDAEKDVISEYKILKRLHTDKNGNFQVNIRGLQDAPNYFIEITSSLKKTGTSLGFEGKKYDGDGIKLQKKKLLVGSRGIDIIHQLFSGLKFLQDKNIAHADIKPGNILVRLPSNDNESVIAHLADLGGAHIFQEESLQQDYFLDQNHTPEYTSLRDVNVIIDLIREGYRKKKSAQEINSFKQKAKEFARARDVYALCLSIGQMAAGDSFIDRILAGVDVVELADMFQNELQKKGIPEEISKLLIRGLNPDYKNRPTAKEILSTIEEYQNL